MGENRLRPVVIRGKMKLHIAVKEVICMDEKNPGLIRYSQSQCMQCKTVSQVKEYHGLDLTRSPEGKELLLKGEFFQWRCPKCGLEADTAWPCWYFDPEAKLGISLAPGIDSSSGEGVVQAMNQSLEGLELSDMTRRVVGNFYAMQELVRAQDLGLDHRVIQLIKPLIIGQLQSHGEVVWNGFSRGCPSRTRQRSPCTPSSTPLKTTSRSTAGPSTGMTSTSLTGILYILESMR